MRLLINLCVIVPLALGCNPVTDECASLLILSGQEFCTTYTRTVKTATTSLPAWATACFDEPTKISSQCSCFATATGSTTTAATTLKTTTTTATSTTARVVVSIISVPTATGRSGGTSAACTGTANASISSPVKSCSNIVLSGISAPASSTIDLSSLKSGSKVTFAGETVHIEYLTFDSTSDSDFNPIVIFGTGVTITGASGHVIDGNDQHTGMAKVQMALLPNHSIVAKDLTNTVFSNLNIQNWPVHYFDITGGNIITLTSLNLDNSAGIAANSASDGLPAGRNTNRFDTSSADNLILENTYVSNQDDCVAITSGTNILVTGMNCAGGHGLSIGSVGGKSDNAVDTVTFQNPVVTNSENGCRIKTNSGTTGTASQQQVDNNITISGITDYGIDVHQDYSNGGPTGDPTNGAIISGVSFIDVKGTVESSADYYVVLCGSGSCSDFTFSVNDITGGSTSCDYPSTGSPQTGQETVVD